MNFLQLLKNTICYPYKVPGIQRVIKNCNLYLREPLLSIFSKKFRKLSRQQKLCYNASEEYNEYLKQQQFTRNISDQKYRQFIERERNRKEIAKIHNVLEAQSQKKKEYLSRLYYLARKHNEGIFQPKLLVTNSPDLWEDPLKPKERFILPDSTKHYPFQPKHDVKSYHTPENTSDKYEISLLQRLFLSLPVRKHQESPEQQEMPKMASKNYRKPLKMVNEFVSQQMYGTGPQIYRRKNIRKQHTIDKDLALRYHVDRVNDQTTLKIRKNKKQHSTDQVFAERYVEKVQNQTMQKILLENYRDCYQEKPFMRNIINNHEEYLKEKNMIKKIAETEQDNLKQQAYLMTLMKKQDQYEQQQEYFKQIEEEEISMEKQNIKPVVKICAKKPEYIPYSRDVDFNRDMIKNPPYYPHAPDPCPPPQEEPYYEPAPCPPDPVCPRELPPMMPPKKTIPVSPSEVPVLPMPKKSRRQKFGDIPVEVLSFKRAD